MDCYIAGNWKMNGRHDWAIKPSALMSELGGDVPDNVRVIFIPPALYVGDLAKSAHSAGLLAGAQNCHFEEGGAFTGEVSASMCADCEADFVICGHSERRAMFGETDEIVRKKALAVHEAGMTAIICIGETLEQRESGEANDVIAGQLKGSLPASTTSINTIIAYEPVWAIGTGKVAELDDIAQMHAHIRECVKVEFGEYTSENLPIQYGGSVKPGNAKEILALKDVNGALVGGASLDMESFAAIIMAAG